MNTKLVVLLFGALLSFSAVAQDKPQYLGDRHVARGVQCQVCHGDKISAQLKEDDQRHEPCVQCHGFYDQVAKKTTPENPEEMNPHSQHDGNLPCTTCHKGHKPGVNYCAQCHFFNFKVP